MYPFSAALAAMTTTPVSMPPMGPNAIAAEIVALVAHSVVGQDWLSATHWSEAINSVESTKATTTTISASTHAGRRPISLEVGNGARDAPPHQYGE